MQLTNSQIVNANSALQALATITTDTVIRFRINQNVKALAPHIETWQEARKGIVDRLVCKDEKTGEPVVDNNQYVWQDGKKDEAIAQLTELDAIETDVKVQKIKLSRLDEHIDGEIDYQIIAFLDWLIEDDVD